MLPPVQEIRGCRRKSPVDGIEIAAIPPHSDSRAPQKSPDVGGERADRPQGLSSLHNPSRLAKPITLTTSTAECNPSYMQKDQPRRYPKSPFHKLRNAGLWQSDKEPKTPVMDMPSLLPVFPRLILLYSSDFATGNGGRPRPSIDPPSRYTVAGSMCAGENIRAEVAKRMDRLVDPGCPTGTTKSGGGSCHSTDRRSGPCRLRQGIGLRGRQQGEQISQI